MNNFETYLQQVLTSELASTVKDAMIYSLGGNGKRIRPKLLLTLVEAYGYNAQAAYPCACAVEMIHTYSLIHDDLPAMDDDKMRRGVATCHIAFDEASAILAGDALLTKAFELVLSTSERADINLKLVNCLAAHSGINGMIYGQCLDLAGENKQLTLQEIINIHKYKTGKLIALPLVCAAIICEDENNIARWNEFGEKLGLLFQVQDDILDVIGNSNVLGKEVGRDQQKEKATIVQCLGLTKARTYASELYLECKRALNDFQIKKTGMVNILDEIYNRIK